LGITNLYVKRIPDINIYIFPIDVRTVRFLVDKIITR
jgi:hypothetical protein